jgi:hypothetical protein
MVLLSTPRPNATERFAPENNHLILQRSPSWFRSSLGCLPRRLPLVIGDLHPHVHSRIRSDSKSAIIASTWEQQPPDRVSRVIDRPTQRRIHLSGELISAATGNDLLCVRHTPRVSRSARSDRRQRVLSLPRLTMRAQRAARSEPGRGTVAGDVPAMAPGARR